MKNSNFLLVLTSFFIFSCGPQINSTENKVFPIAEDQSINKIVGGQGETTDPINSATVGIIFSEGRFCTGAYIGNYKVLTAAHCFYAKLLKLEPRSVRFYTTSSNNVKNSCYIKSYKIKPGFKGPENHWENDLALIELESSSCDLSKYHQYNLNTHSSGLWQDTDTKSSGFGNFKYGSNYGSAFPLKSLTNKKSLLVGTSQQLTEVYDMIAYPEEIADKANWVKAMAKATASYLRCYQTNAIYESLYKGDSGGPTYVISSEQKLDLLGVFSNFYTTNSNVEKSVMYCLTNLEYYRDWILKN